MQNYVKTLRVPDVLRPQGVDGCDAESLSLVEIYT